MIEIVSEATQNIAINSAHLLKIASIVKAWKKIEDDPDYAESQKDLVSRTSMARIFQIITEGKNEEYQRIDL